jgi:hypothetical protein
MLHLSTNDRAQPHRSIQFGDADDDVAREVRQAYSLPPCSCERCPPGRHPRRREAPGAARLVKPSSTRVPASAQPEPPARNTPGRVRAAGAAIPPPPARDTRETCESVPPRFSAHHNRGAATRLSRPRARAVRLDLVGRHTNSCSHTRTRSGADVRFRVVRHTSKSCYYQSRGYAQPKTPANLAVFTQPFTQDEPDCPIKRLCAKPPTPHEARDAHPAHGVHHVTSRGIAY